MDRREVCPDCEASEASLRHTAPDRDVTRRAFLRTTGAAAAAAGLAPLGALAAEAPAKSKSASTPESLVKVLYDSLSDTQKAAVCFDWDYVETKSPSPRGRARGLLRTYVANNWNITPQVLKGGKVDFYTKEQQQIVREIFEGLIRPEWHARIDKQLEDDAGGFGHDQSLAIFGKPGDGKFEFVMTGRHMTLRCDGNSTPHVAFGGPIFYGHAAADFNEPADHPGNVFWPQALAANKLYQMLDGKEQKQALVANMPREQASGFRSPSEIAGLPVSEMSSDQKEHLQGVLKLLLEPYRTDDQSEALACLNKHGGLDKCSLAFYSAGDIGNDKVWDNWRLEGPAFVWHFRGAPHVHVWVNVADDTSVKLNS